MRVLFSSTWGYGHVLPMLPLAKAFVASGHAVVWATSADSCARVAAAGIDTAPAGLRGAALRACVQSQTVAARAAALPEDQAAFIYPRMFGEAFTPPMLADLLPLATGWRPDLLIHEHGELSSPLVGALLGVPSVTHAFGGAIPASFLTAAGRRLELLWEQHGQPVPPFAGCFTSVYLDICPAAVQTVESSHIPAIQQLRPVQDDDGSPSADLPRGDDPLVYLTLGTVFNDAALLRAALDTLAALPLRLLVALGPGRDVTALGSVPANVRVARWVNQSQVLRHCDVVASHGGSGTFLGALAEGLPQLCMPQGADQFRNSRGGVQSGAALVLLPEEADPGTVARAVSRLLNEESFRRNALRVAAEIRAMPSPAEVVATLQHLA